MRRFSMASLLILAVTVSAATGAKADSTHLPQATLPVQLHKKQDCGATAADCTLVIGIPVEDRVRPDDRPSGVPTTKPDQKVEQGGGGGQVPPVEPPKNQCGYDTTFKAEQDLLKKVNEKLGEEQWWADQIDSLTASPRGTQKALEKIANWFAGLDAAKRAELDVRFQQLIDDFTEELKNPACAMSPPSN